MFWGIFDPSFFERGVPSPPTRRRPTRLAAEVIHLPVVAFSIFTDDGVAIGVSALEVMESLTFFADDMVGDIKLAL